MPVHTARWRKHRLGAAEVVVRLHGRGGVGLWPLALNLEVSEAVAAQDAAAAATFGMGPVGLGPRGRHGVSVGVGGVKTPPGGVRLAEGRPCLTTGLLVVVLVDLVVVHCGGVGQVMGGG